MKRLCMVGASGHGRVCAEIAELSGRYADIFFLDDDTDIKNCGRYLVKGTVEKHREYIDSDTDFFISIGNCSIRKRIQEEIAGAGGSIATLIHPQSVISKETEIAEGTVIMAGTVVNPGAIIGKGVILNTTSSVDHDCVIGDYTHIAVGAHICGTVHVGGICLIGAGSTVINNKTITTDTIIGAGAVVVSDIDTHGTYVGVPAKRITA